MKKILVPILALTVITAACLPVVTPPPPAPQVDTQATIDSIVNTAAAQTLAAQPSPTLVPPTETAVAAVEPSATSANSDAPSSTPVPNLTTTPATATSGAVDNTSVTSTATMAAPGAITLTPTLGVLTYGTLPPAVPSSQVTLVNKSKTQAYISLQLYDTVAKGAILEYPVQNTVKIKAPLGNYVYVVWVGGRQLVGTLKVSKGEELKITIYKDKITIQ